MQDPGSELADKIRTTLNLILRTSGAKVEPDGPNKFYVTDPEGNIVLVTTQTIARRHSPARKSAAAYTMDDFR